MSLLGFNLNGHVYSHQSVECRIASAPYDLTDMDYSNAVELGEIRGHASNPRGTSRGVENVSAGFSMYRGDGDVLLAQLAALSGVGAYGEARFDILITFYEAGLGTPAIAKDRMIGCRVVNAQVTSSESNQEVTKMAFQLHVTKLLLNNLPAIGGIGDAAKAIIGSI